MCLRVVTCCAALCLVLPPLAAAQTVADVAAPAAFGAERAEPPVESESLRPLRAPADGFWRPFQDIPGDFTRFFSAGTSKILGLGGAGALVTHQWDHAGMAASHELEPKMFAAGNLGGTFLVQTGAGIGLYSIARLSGAGGLAAAGADLIRGQMLAQGVVQAGKFTTRRSRPDDSNRHSLPSGHTASAFVTATVLNDHFGWKAGVPAYAFGAYVAASRMSANKHHLSDVVLGATVGIAAGRSVTLGTRTLRFSLGVRPTPGGAAITMTKQ